MSDHGHGHHEEHWSEQYVRAGKNVTIQLTLLLSLFYIFAQFIHQ